jgi:hypothetical protein
MTPEDRERRERDIREYGAMLADSIRRNLRNFSEISPDLQ